MKVSLCMPMVPRTDAGFEGTHEEMIVRHFTVLLEGMAEAKKLPDSFLVNTAFYEQYGVEGLRALEKVVALCKSFDKPVVLDMKRSDWGHASAASARFAFDQLEVDAVTVSPLLGHDAVRPYLLYEKQVFILARGSNPGAHELQDAIVGGKPFFLKVAEKAAQWKCGVLMGGTLDEIEMVAALNVPLLVSGNLRDVLGRLRKVKCKQPCTFVMEENADVAPLRGIVKEFS